MSMAEAIRIGIVGAGGIVRQRHLPGFSKIEGVEIVAVCNRSPESTAKVADEYSIPLRLTDWKELVHHPDVDAVVVGTWPYLHKEVSVEALQAGKPVFCQARMARDASEARAMLKAQQQSGQVAMLCPPPNGMKWDLAMKRLLAGEAVGRIRTVRVLGMGNQFLDPESPLHWRQDQNLSGFNVLTLGIYAEIVRRWFGNHESVQATCQTTTATRRVDGSPENRPVEIPDAVWVNAQLESGAVVQYSLSGISHCAPKDRVEVYGSKGTLVYEITSEKIFMATLADSELKQVTPPEEETRDWEVELDFIRAIRGEKDPEPSFEDGVAYMDVVEATARSCKTGERVHLPLAS